MQLRNLNLNLATTLVTISSVLGLPNLFEKLDAWDTQKQNSPDAKISSPLPEQILHRGESFTVLVENSAGRREFSSQVALVNTTGKFLLSDDLARSKNIIVLPRYISNGVYGFVYSEKSEGIISQLQPEDVTFTIRVEDIPRQVNLSPFVIQAQDERHQDVKKIKLEKREPHLPRFKYPVHNQSISPGDTVRISFVDGELDTQQAQFVLREKGAPPGVNDTTLAGPGSIDSNFSFVDYSIVTDLIFPSSTTSGPHTLVARELYPNSTKKTLEVASVDVIISPNMPAEGELPKIKRQSLNEFQASLGKFEKRAPHLPFFRLPIENQTFITGHHINILLEDGELPSKVARFLIRKKFPTEEDKDLVLYGKNCSSEGFFFFKNYTVKARVLLPQLVPNGTYYLIAQEKFNKKSKKVFEVKSLEIQVEREEFFASSSPDPTSSGITKIVKGPVLAAVNTSIKDAVTKKLSPTRHRAPPHRIRLSPSIISPTGAQDVPIGSQFECKVQDSRATSEIAQFVLRNQNGKEFYLGSASFKRGVAIAKVNCPKQLKFDSYTVVARVNSLDKPKTFLDAISVTILVTHSQNVLPSLVSASKKLEKRDTEVSKLYKPYWNQVIAPGKQFECNITDKTTKATTVKYCIRYDDGRSDLYVGQADIKNGVGATYCKVPSSQVAGTYMFVAQENIPSSPKKFRDVQSILITLSIPKNYRNVQHQSLLEQQDEKVVGINFNSRASAINSNLKDPMQSFTLLNPMPNKILVRGEIFAVELENSNLTYSSLMKFVLRPEITSNLNQAYELGVSSRGSEKLDARFLCPEVVPSGAYNFVVQESDLNDPTTYRDVTTIRVLVVNNKKEGEIKARGDDFDKGSNRTEINHMSNNANTTLTTPPTLSSSPSLQPNESISNNSTTSLILQHQLQRSQNETCRNNNSSDGCKEEIISNNPTNFTSNSTSVSNKTTRLFGNIFTNSSNKINSFKRYSNSVNSLIVLENNNLTILLISSLIGLFCLF